MFMSTVQFFNACQCLSKMQKVERMISSVCSDSELSYIQACDAFDQAVNMKIKQSTQATFDHKLEDALHVDLICDIIEELKKIDVTEIEFINNEVKFDADHEIEFVLRKAVCIRLSMKNYLICYF